MHWCDVETNRSTDLESIDFESALENERGNITAASAMGPKEEEGWKIPPIMTQRT